WTELNPNFLEMKECIPEVATKDITVKRPFRSRDDPLRKIPSGQASIDKYKEDNP
ncbi:hypothetical protein BGZ80_006821, partial [Entomortierella chlamydospora]